MRFLLIQNDAVAKAFTAESQEEADKLALVLGGSALQGDAAIGDVWNEELGQYLPPRPAESWTFDADARAWVAPTAKPEGEGQYLWDEESLNWVEVLLPEPDPEAPAE